VFYYSAQAPSKVFKDLFKAEFTLEKIVTTMSLSFHFCLVEDGRPKLFSSEKKLQKQPNAVTSNGSRPLQHHQKNYQVTNQKALWHAVQPSLQQKNHRAPDFHTVAPGLHTVVFPPNHQLQTEYSLPTPYVVGPS
jgi:hypothetical protein